MDTSIDPSTVLDEARELAGKGAFAEALLRHLWFHQHALDHEPALYGVRLSFALSDWFSLGQSYPPALDALKGIRDAKEAELAGGGGSRQLFHDVTAINSYLGEAVKTVELFRLLDAGRPELAAECYWSAEDALAGQGECALAARYIPDPDARFDNMRRRREELVRFHQDHAQGPDEADLEARLEIGRTPERLFAIEVRLVTAILDGAGRAEEAERVRRMALATSDCPEVREALGLPPTAG